ncbi:hypothetical protein GCM10010170_033020 [Dactylosporangium salmoneum]|uniref:Secreted protein n=1 Tax=Dactylosporangium salmoneum TaxID=53361 RepID=A0ABN3G896_9ACTN
MPQPLAPGALALAPLPRLAGAPLPQLAGTPRPRLAGAPRPLEAHSLGAALAVGRRLDCGARLAFRERFAVGGLLSHGAHRSLGAQRPLEGHLAVGGRLDCGARPAFRERFAVGGLLSHGARGRGLVTRVSSASDGARSKLVVRPAGTAVRDGVPASSITLPRGAGEDRGVGTACDAL